MRESNIFWARSSEQRIEAERLGWKPANKSNYHSQGNGFPMMWAGRGEPRLPDHEAVKS